MVCSSTKTYFNSWMAWMDEERSSAAPAQPQKRPIAVIATLSGLLGSQPSTSADFFGAAPVNKKDKKSDATNRAATTNHPVTIATMRNSES
jgi:hypothetical protein